LVELEEDEYRNNGLVTYIADEYLLDIFSDTTERAPTFMLPHFRQAGDTVSPASWAFAKNPLKSTRKTWNEMLQRKPRGLSWEIKDYRQMNAPEWLCSDPPILDTEEIYRFQIGQEGDASRYRCPHSALILVYVADTRSERTKGSLLEAYRRGAPHYQRALCFVIGDGNALQCHQDKLLIPLQLRQTPMFLFFHLAVKIIFNAVSTATMGRMGRIKNNWMIQVATSNKKLIDRSTRIISEIAGISYDEACLELFRTMEEFKKGQASANTSYLVATLERLKRLS
jgi:N-acetylmuramic acid 6-phosphate etherase